MKIERLIEARKNPAQNKKVDILNYLQSIYDECEMLPNGQRNAFISFVMIEKLGINPRPIDNNTPTGIYAYPVSSVIERMNQGYKFKHSVPYAGGYPIINLLKIKNVDKCLFLSDENLNDRLKLKLGDIFIENEMTKLERVIELNGDSVYKGFQDFMYSHFGEKSTPAKLNRVLRKVGFESVFDDTGNSLIAVEPTQIVFLNSSAVEHIETIQNPMASLETNNAVGIRFDKSFKPPVKYDHQSITSPLSFVSKLTNLKITSFEDAVEQLKSLSEYKLNNLEYEFGNRYRDFNIVQVLNKRVIFDYENFGVAYDSAITQIRMYIAYMDFDKKMSDAGVFPHSHVDFDKRISDARTMLKFLTYTKSVLLSTALKKLFTDPTLDEYKLEVQVINFFHKKFESSEIGSKIPAHRIYASSRFGKMQFGVFIATVFIKILNELLDLE
jgi:hypothetical protein